jgi:transmembrane serine protease 9
VSMSRYQSSLVGYRLKRNRFVMFIGHARFLIPVLFTFSFASLAWAEEIATQRQLGPESLYARIGPRSGETDGVPLVVLDVLQNIKSNDRLLVIEPRIIGGSPAPIGAYPWQASIGLRGVAPLAGHFCGGSLIAPRWIISAAHCVYGQTSPDNLQVLLGSNFLDRDGQTFSVDRILIHEGWKSSTFDYDVALLHLTESSTQTPIKLVELNKATELAGPGLIAIVSGWGITLTTDRRASNVLRNVGVQLVTKADCAGPASYPNAISDRMVCAGFAEGAKDACQGDSGGPLMVPDKKGGLLLAGIVSWGEGCAKPGKYGVYTYVPVIQDWVARKLAAN